MKDKCVHFGIIGGAGYALALLGWLETLIEEGRVCLHAAAVLPHEQGGELIRRARSRGTKIYDNWEAMLEATRGELDLCLIPTGIAQHRSMSVRALELGHRVFLEKPLAGCFEDALAIVRCAQEHGDRLSVGYQDLYQPSTRHIHDVIWGGAIGKLRSIRAYGLWRRNAAYYGRNGWAGRMRIDAGWVLDSPLNNALAHFLNLSLFWASPDAGLVARFSGIDAELYRARDIENFDTASIRILTECGAPVEFHVSHSCLENTGPFIRIEGESGHIDWKMNGEYTIHTGGQTESFPLESSSQTRVNMFNELIEWVNGRPAQRCSGVQALGQSLCITLLHRFGRIETVPAAQLDPAAAEGAPAIIGIDDLFRKCFEQGGLPSEHGAVWGKGVVSMRTPAQLQQEWDALARGHAASYSLSGK